MHFNFSTIFLPLSIPVSQSSHVMVWHSRFPASLFVSRRLFMPTVLALPPRKQRSTHEYFDRSLKPNTWYCGRLLKCTENGRRPHVIMNSEFGSSRGGSTLWLFPSPQNLVKVREGVSRHAADFLLFSKRRATGPSCGKSIHMPHLHALRGCSLVSSTASTATNER